MSERKLASVRRIGNLQPIIFKNADGNDETAGAIEVATIDGWNAVVKKGEFKVGQLCVYLEVDSLVPRTSWSEFLFKGDEEKARIKTIKLKGQVSQGLVVPLESVFSVQSVEFEPGHIAYNITEEDGKVIFYTKDSQRHEYEEGDDLTEVLGIEKWEITMPAQLSGVAKGNFPGFLRKTDEERIQNCFNRVFPHFKQPFFATEKVDGSSFTCYVKDGEFGVCSRNLELKESDESAFWKTAREYDLKERMLKFGRNIAFQAEMVGPGIQGNKLGLSEIQLFGFNLFDIDNQEFFDYANFQFGVQKTMELKTAPVIEVFDELPFTSVDEMVAYATRKSVLNPKVWAEGVVFRPKRDHEIDRFGRLSFKAINPNFLLKYNE